MGLAILLGACSATQVYQPAAPQGEPPTEHGIASDIPHMFAEAAHPTDILVTPARPVVEQGLFGWLVCVRARTVAVDGSDAGFETLAVFYQKRAMVLRRRAQPLDKCDGFEKLGVSSQQQ
jgi:hypothetical protein